MAENLTLDSTLTKAEQYQQLLPQIEALTTGEPDLTANLANTAAALRQAFGFFWVGFYLVKGDELVLGPFQGPIACTRIRHADLQRALLQLYDTVHHNVLHCVFDMLCTTHLVY